MSIEERNALILIVRAANFRERGYESKGEEGWLGKKRAKEPRAMDGRKVT